MLSRGFIMLVDPRRPPEEVVPKDVDILAQLGSSLAAFGLAVFQTAADLGVATQHLVPL